MGWELILTAVVATMLTRSWEHSSRRATAEWQSARRAAHARQQARAKQRQARASARAKRVHTARRSGPRDPLWFPFAAGWLAAAAARASYAAAKGARDGGAVGAREGYRLGRESARKRRQRRERAAFHNGQASTRPGHAGDATQAPGPAAPRYHAAAGDEVATDPCTGCGTYIPAGELDGDGRCRACASARRDPDGDLYFGDDPRDPNAVADCSTCSGRAVVGDPPEPCPSCLARQRARDSDYQNRRLALDAIGDGMRWRPGDPVADQLASGDTHNTDEDEEVVDAELIDDTDHTTNNTDHGNENERTPMSEMQAISMNGSSLSGGEGEGYASTIAALGRVSELLGRVNEVVQDLGDTLTARHVDAQTIAGLSDLDDQLQAATATTGSTLAHAREKHEPVAAAVAGAGGSAEVADTDWYDDV